MCACALLLTVHAAVIAINDAIERQIPAETFGAMRNPNAMLVNLEEALAPDYQGTLYQAKQEKTANARNRVGAPCFLLLLPREVTRPHGQREREETMLGTASMSQNHLSASWNGRIE